ncbi:MAG TPA: GNAT family N-acetyltransferase [Chitinispirillaceae bacterium]|nr:GNAT family N-acetyltransferase [Chitinispirillaceae bacterium]
MIKIEYLKKFPEHLNTVVGWVYPEWWHNRCSFEEVVELYRTLLNDRFLPIAIIAFKDGVPAGTALICKDDPDIKEGVSPWLEGLFVCKEFRMCGIGTALVARIETIAMDVGYDSLYLSSGLDGFYQELNYSAIKKLENGDTLFEKSLVGV